MLWRDGVPEGETIAQVGERVDRVLDDFVLSTATRCSSRTGMCCASSPHDGSAWNPTRAGSSHSIPTLSTLGYERETPVIRHWNQGVATQPRK